MITTRRLEEQNSIYSNQSRSNVALLEKEEVKNSNYSAEVREETYEEAKERMQRNLNKLLNYDNTALATNEEAKVETEEVALNVTISENEEDLKPSSTTMQFIEQDVAKNYEDMKKTSVTASNQKAIVNSGKRFLMVLYSLAVTVILALIILNTGVLASLNKSSEAKQAELAGIFSEYNQKIEDINSITNNDYVVQWAEQNGMAKR